MRKDPTSTSGLFNPRVLLALTLCATGLFLAAFGFATTPTPPSWSTVSSPNANAAQTFNAVACTSASDCWGVGNRYNTNVWRDVTLIEHWNGTAWTIVTSPNAMSEDGFVESSFLESVTCAAASD